MQSLGGVWRSTLFLSFVAATGFVAGNFADAKEDRQTRVREDLAEAYSPALRQLERDVKQLQEDVLNYRAQSIFPLEQQLQTATAELESIRIAREKASALADIASAVAKVGAADKRRESVQQKIAVTADLIDQRNTVFDKKLEKLEELARGLEKVKVQMTNIDVAAPMSAQMRAEYLRAVIEHMKKARVNKLSGRLVTWVFGKSRKSERQVSAYTKVLELEKKLATIEHANVSQAPKDFAVLAIPSEMDLKWIEKRLEVLRQRPEPFLLEVKFEQERLIKEYEVLRQESLAAAKNKPARSAEIDRVLAELRSRAQTLPLDAPDDLAHLKSMLGRLQARPHSPFVDVEAERMLLIEQYKARIAAAEKITPLPAQIKALSDRVTALEKTNVDPKYKQVHDEEISRLLRRIEALRNPTVKVKQVMTYEMLGLEGGRLELDTKPTAQKGPWSYINDQTGAFEALTLGSMNVRRLAMDLEMTRKEMKLENEILQELRKEGASAYATDVYKAKEASALTLKRQAAAQEVLLHRAEKQFLEAKYALRVANAAMNAHQLRTSHRSHQAIVDGVRETAGGRVFDCSMFGKSKH